jgi:hypothetical protein
VAAAVDHIVAVRMVVGLRTMMVQEVEDVVVVHIDKKEVK